MTEQEKVWRQKWLEAQTHTEELLIQGSLPLNCAPAFREVYRQHPGLPRRRSLVALFLRYPLSRLPVNNRGQANVCDPDLRYLLKKGVLVTVREGGRRQHPLNKSSRQRQTYLVLAAAAKEAA